MTAIVHGTYTAYGRHRCRCEECRTAQNARVAANRADRLANGRITHGKRSGYDAGCRCEQCRAARRRASYRESTRVARTAQIAVAPPTRHWLPTGGRESRFASEATPRRREPANGTSL